MKKVLGINLKELPYKITDFVGTLLFAHYPSTMLYSDENKNPIVKEWVDCSEDNSIDRFFYYSVERFNLKKFIDGEMLHIDLIHSSIQSYIVFQDIKENEVLNTTLLSIHSIPVNYRPSIDFSFDYNDSVDVIDIIDYFELDKIEIKEKTIELVKEISIKANSETIYIHLNKGKGIGLGTVNTEVFGKTLTHFDKLYKNVALDFLLGNDRGEISLEAKKNEEYLEFTETMIYGEKITASYGFLLRPMISSQIDMFGETKSQKIATKAFDLIKKSQDTENLHNEYVLHSGFTINSFKKLLEIVIKLQLNIDFNWFDPLNKNQISDNLDYKKANKIITDLDKLAITKSQDFKEKGKFRAVNCDTMHYSFISLGEQQYSGYFDKLIKENLVSINFLEIYEIKISRLMIKEAGKQDEKTTDTITSYYLDT